MEYKIAHFLHCPFTGLGLYNGFRGNRWLKNRIKIFKQFIVPSLQAQTNKNFVLWCAFRFEEKNNPLVQELQEYMNAISDFKTVFTFSGICFYDDKYEDSLARERLISSVHGSMAELLNVMGEADTILMTIQPSDDLYRKDFVEGIQNVFKGKPDLQAAGFSHGYICNYRTKEVKNYDPQTNPPFYTIKFPRDIFIDPFKHVNYTALKTYVGKYKAGTPLPSHEYVKDCLNYGIIHKRGFVVGVHGENISTHIDNPFAGDAVSQNILKDFGIYDVEPLKIKYSIRKRILRALPHRTQRKLRYWFGEILWQRLYNFLRG